MTPPSPASPAPLPALAIGLVGCGRWGRHILRDLQALGAAVTVADPDAAARAQALQQGAAGVADLTQLPPDLAGYVIASPAGQHGRAIEALLERDRPIFVEKPFTTDSASAQRLAAAGRGRLFVMEKWLWHPAVRFLTALARRKDLGPVELLACARLQPDLPIRDVDPVWTLLPHDLSIAREILGTLPEPRLARAERRDGKLVGLVGLLSGGSNPAASRLRDATPLLPVPAPLLHIEVSAARAERQRSILLGGSEGLAFWSDGAPETVFVGRRPATARDTRDAINTGDFERHEVTGEMPLKAELRDFLAHLAGGPPPRASAAGGALVVERIDALRRLAGVEDDA
jgi:predicted dehydrogenase